MSNDIDVIEPPTKDILLENVIIIRNTMSEELLIEAVKLTKEGFKSSGVEKDVATVIKKGFDAKIPGSTCINSSIFYYFKQKHKVCITLLLSKRFLIIPKVKWSKKTI
ncbi:Dynein Light Chain family member (dlc-3) [Reticulomyxa filosa]|uniref:Dynein Light Chain family member (Dlc-3) n=1 Tax=Reticulomyxa filosa TaxID=46433 RepID=X6M3M7_RETFI|nr:Dynein Light Chain family member (dlc-3) [Reticulomyxa filosa]|eukprot:ETO08231.1 Dynein Light Chain family member (dlc-3) [Reticulomyxa filosa]